LSHPVPAAGECGHRSSICSGFMFEPYAAYRPPSCSPICGGAYRAWAASGTMGTVTGARVESGKSTRIVVFGGGPAGYEAALVAAQLGAAVTIVDRDGIGGACVLTDCVPSKTLSATTALA